MRLRSGEVTKGGQRERGNHLDSKYVRFTRPPLATRSGFLPAAQNPLSSHIPLPRVTEKVPAIPLYPGNVSYRRKTPYTLSLHPRPDLLTPQHTVHLNKKDQRDLSVMSSCRRRWPLPTGSALVFHLVISPLRGQAPPSLQRSSSIRVLARTSTRIPPAL